MIPLNNLAMAFFQDSASAASAAHDLHEMRIYFLFIVIGLGLQAVGVLLVAVYAAMFLKTMHTISRSVHDKALPMIEKTTQLVTDLTPKINSISTNVEQVSYTVREKIDELGVTLTQLNETVAEANGRTRAQVVRVDGMVSEALDTTEEVSRTVQQGIRTPIREVAAIIAGIKVAVETLIERSPFKKRPSA